jgi:hypothetical protein
VRLHWLGALAPSAQMTLRPGFLLAAEGAANLQLTTGLAPWAAFTLPEFTAQPKRKLPGAHFIGPGYRIDGTRRYQGGEVPLRTLGAAVPPQLNGRIGSQWSLCPSDLPDQLRTPWTGWTARMEVPAWLADEAVVDPAWTRPDELLRAKALAAGEPVLVAPWSEWSALLDAETILTAYIGVEVSNGAGGEIDLSWAESLGTAAALVNNNFLIEKGHRDEVAGKRFYGFGDTFIPAGGEECVRLEAPWWRAGRYLLVKVRTAGEPLRLERLVCTLTRYPLAVRSRFSSAGDPRLSEVLALCERGLRASCHDIYADCPAYEQLMYAGDSRVEMLLHRTLDTDDRLARKAIQLFNDSRHGGRGWTWSRYPAQLGQIIPGFSLLWVLMVDDFHQWRPPSDFVPGQLSGVRATLDLFETHLGADGWLRGLPGWHFIDWCPRWENGVPPGDASGRSAPVNLLYLLALRAGARLEAAAGAPHRQAHLLHLAERVKSAVRDGCREAGSGLFADAPGLASFSEHTQVLATLALIETRLEKRALLDAMRLAGTRLAPVSYYFSHYLFEACREAGAEWLHERLSPWRELLAKGLRTPIEAPEPSRSDCHGWASHPLFHAYATVAGIRPGSPGFATVVIEPLPGPLTSLRVEFPWREALLKLNLTFSDGRAAGIIDLPPGLTGEFRWRGATWPLASGIHRL